MNTIVLRRPSRRPPPELPRGELVLESPPELPETLSGGFGAALTYLPMLAGGGAMAFLFIGPAARGITVVAGVMYALSMAGMAVGQVGRGASEKKRALNAERRDYARYLSQVRRRVRRAASQQREALLWRSPDPDALWSIALSARLWERRPADEDFGTVRVGLGPQRLAVTLVPPETKPVEDLEPVSAGALRRFVRTHSTVADLPVSLSIRGFGRIVLDAATPAAQDAMLGLVRAMVAQLAVFHSPDDLRIAVCAGPGQLPRWDWVKWLPHALHPTEVDAAGPVRVVAGQLAELEQLLGGELAQRPRFGAASPADAYPHCLVILDGGEVSFDAQLAGTDVHAVTVLDVSGRLPRDAGERGTLRLSVTPERIERLVRDRAGTDARSSLGQPDQLSLAEAESLARLLAPYRVSTAAGEAEDSLSRDLGLTRLLGLGDPTRIETSVTWRPRPPRDRLRVPIGVGPLGEPVELDIKEAAQDGMGPHGLVIGATGSGKSELLRTLVLGLAVTHSSDALNFVLVDFKGGATFARLEDLPHTSAVITNLADDLSQVDRMRDAIDGELNRRQELLRDAGNYASLRDYQRARENGAPLAAVPSLFVVVDEFSELLTAKPDFIDLFITIGRIGRSLGVHLLLASQRLEEGRLRGLDTYLSYRIGLRTFSAMESRVVLGVPDAYELPNAPGHGYLKIDTSTMLRFKAAYVSGPYAGPRETPTQQAAAVAGQVVPYTVGYLRPLRAPVAEPVAPPVDANAETMLEIVTQRLVGRGSPAHQVWLPPLAEPPTLAQLLPPLAADPADGLRPAGWAGRGQLQIPVGLVDKPYHQRRDPLWLDLSGSGGHVIVAGGPQSGKSALVRDIIAGLALTHTPAEAQFYCLDFGGGTLSGLLGLPHVGAVAGRLEADLIRRTLAEVTALLAGREKLFTEQRIDSMATYRRRRRDGSLPGDGYGDVFLVVDGWGVVRSDFDPLEAQITGLAARGLGYGVHVLITVQRWMEVRPALRDLVGTRLELRLGDPTESDVDRRAAANVPEKAPGRGLTRGKLQFLAALPRIDRDQRPETLVDGVASLVSAVADAWAGPPAPQVELLPDNLPYAALPAPANGRAGIPIGVDEDALAPVYLDFSTDPHFVIFGDSQCGKTNLLRAIVTGITTRYTAEQARIIFLDYRYGLLDAAGTAHKLAHGFASNHAPPIVRNIIEGMNKRLPPADLTADRLKARDWWNGPDLYVVIDDYDLVATGSTNPLLPLLDLVPQARDIGLHLIIARAIGGAGRAMFEPVLQRLRETGTPALIMSGSKEEGALFGNVKPDALPPGRGRLATRRGSTLIQTAYLPPPP
ncbi:MAG TPA: type VII secretion protein EccCa [Mycobacteriales bacterium]|nr:type VII secretion protein EccCa [Mycobacteriales bacterium]